MSFNLEKYLVENNLTLISRIREQDEEPTQADVAGAEKQYKGIDKKVKEFAELKAKMIAIRDKYTVKDEQGNIKLTDKKFPNPDPKKKGEMVSAITAYKAEVGNMPDRLKALKKAIDAVKTPDAGGEPEED